MTGASRRLAEEPKVEVGRRPIRDRYLPDAGLATKRPDEQPQQKDYPDSNREGGDAWGPGTGCGRELGCQAAMTSGRSAPVA